MIRPSSSWCVPGPVNALAPLRKVAAHGRSATLELYKVLGHLRHDGTSETAKRVRDALKRRRRRTGSYDQWVRRHEVLEDADRAAIRAALARIQEPVSISVVMPVYDTNPRYLERAVESVCSQIYDRWQLCIADDASRSRQTRAALDRLVAADDRISLVRRSENGGVAAATNSALAVATGEMVAFLDHDDELVEWALYAVARAVADQPDADIVYSDEDKIDRRGSRSEPYFKPDYNPELLLGQNYFNHLTVTRRSLVEAVGGLRADLDGSQDHDLLLRMVERTTADRIVHIPHILYHWRQFRGSRTLSREHADSAVQAGTRAVREHLERLGQSAEVWRDIRTPGWQRVRWNVVEPPPEVTVVVPTRDRLDMLRPCVEGVLWRTDYPAVRVLVADNDSVSPETLAYLDELRDGERTGVVRVPGEFNYSAINNFAVREVASPLVLLLNNDIQIRDPGWLSEMVGVYQARDRVGAVGAKLLYRSGTVQHAGIIVGVGGVAGHAHKRSSASDAGYFGRLVLTQEVSAVTGACLLTPTSVWNQLGGLVEEHLPVAFNDVDYCLRLREAGYRVLWCANAELSHLESASRGPERTIEQVERFDAETAWMKSRWGQSLLEDRMYSPNLTLEREDYSLAVAPRRAKPWRR